MATRRPFGDNSSGLQSDFPTNTQYNPTGTAAPTDVAAPQPGPDQSPATPTAPAPPAAPTAPAPTTPAAPPTPGPTTPAPTTPGATPTNWDPTTWAPGQPWYAGVAFPNNPNETTGQDPGQVNWAPGSIQQNTPITTPGPGGDSVTLNPGVGGQGPQATVTKPQAAPAWETQWPVPSGDDPTLWSEIGNAITQAGGTIGGPGSGPGDIQYYYDTISKAPGGWGGYDWASRIARGVTGTEPSSGDSGGGQDAIGPNPFATPAGNVGQDPFSQLLTSGFADIIKNKGEPNTDFANTVRADIANTLNTGGKLPNDASTAQFEAARTQLEAAKNAELNSAMADLANRGLAPEGGTNGGGLVTAEDYIGRDLAPAMDTAIANYQINQANLQNQLFGQALGVGNAATTADQTAYENALSGGTNFQNVQTSLALRSLEDSNAFNEFVANYGLNRDEVMYNLQNQQNNTLLQALYQYFIGSSQSSGGHI